VRKKWFKIFIFVHSIWKFYTLSPEIKIELTIQKHFSNLNSLKVNFLRFFLILRIVSQIPLSMFRKTTSQVELFDFKIPKDTIIVPNIWQVHHSPDVYPDPYEFNPQRFLNPETNQLLCRSHEQFKRLISFGTG
jgi:hypothetical protein